MRKVSKRILAVILVVILCFSVSSPLLAETNYSTELLGTNEALGSPLLDTEFQIEDWDPWELITFGVFLSNFANPFIDDYESAFSTSADYGSKGLGLKALQFGSGNDKSSNKILTELLKYAISVQKDTRLMKPLYVKYNTRHLDSITEYKAERPAKVKELFVWTTSTGVSKYNAEINAALGGSERGKWWVGLISRIKKIAAGEGLLDISEIDTGIIAVDPIIKWESGAITDTNVVMNGAQKAILPEFFIKGKNENVTMLNYDAGWDIQMMTAWLGKTFGEKYKDIIKEDYLQEFLECPLYTDAFGNIVAIKDGKPYMMFPAAANQHITESPQYNMLQSVLFGGEYLESNTEDIFDQAYPKDGESGISGISGGDFPKGKSVILYDSDSFLINNAMKSTKKTYNNGGYYAINADTDIKYGKSIAEFMEADINKSQSTETGFRVEIVKADEISDFPRVKSMGRACNVLSLQKTIDTKAPVLNYVKVRGMTQQMFGESIVVSTIKDNPALKRYPDYIHKMALNNQVNAGTTEDWSSLKSKLIDTKKIGESASISITGTSNMDSAVSNTFKKFVKIQTGSTIDKDADKPEMGDPNIDGLESAGYHLKNGDSIGANKQSLFDRCVKIYSYSPVMRQVSNILGTRDGTDFAQYSAYIYVTYLEWYGIIGDQTPKFNTELYAGSEDGTGVFNFDIENVTKGLFLSDEEKKKNILDYTYMMLDPQAGKEYRSEMMMDNLSNWIYNTYENIVYGGSLNYYQSSTLSNRYGNGFLKIDSYTENFMTGWFMEKYAENVVIIIALLSILIIVVGILAHRKIIWFFVSFILMINVVILIPSIGEIAPYIANNSVQNLFDDKMSYWAISEGVTNSTIEKKINNEYKYAEKEVTENNINTEEAQQVLNLVKTLNINYLDRALMMKLDISKKVTETQLYSYDEIQQLQSARWLLPMMLRQFTANGESANYIFVPLADEFDNLSNMYWKYKPSDKAVTQTTGSTEGSGTTQDNYKSTGEIKEMYDGYFDTASNITSQESQITLPSEYKSNIYKSNWRSEARQLHYGSYNTHTFFYYLKLGDSQAIPSNPSGTDWKEYVENYAPGLKTALMNKTTTMEAYAGKYNFTEPESVMEEYGFLWNTENPLHYFYQVVKDSFDSGITVGSLAASLQGEYTKSRITSEEVRKSFMHYEDTGKIKDVVDLEEMFSNMLPYMYSMQLLTGGFDGKSGALGDEKIDIYTAYKNNYKSWLYRSNWVTKLMESPELTKKETVKLPNGTAVTIENPMIPSSYPEERPMIFSEAQMYALGYNESNLTQSELKILKLNKEIERKWTLMINYVNIPGMTNEVIYRQMAVEALLSFNKEFTSISVLNPSLAMYPTGLDLRNISFDSVMKMLMLNSTKDTRYIYGDTMLRVIENNDIFSAILMLIGAFLSSYAIPFIRNVLLGLLFYLGFFAVLSHIMSGNKTKIKITTAFFLNNVVFLAMNLLYYLAFSIMIKLTYKDNVLSISNITINVGNPVWIFIIIVLISVLFIIGSWKLIKFTIINYRDLGFEMYATWSNILAGKISDGVSSMGNSISSMFSGRSNEEERGTGASVGSNRRTSHRSATANMSTDDLDEINITPNNNEDISESTPGNHAGDSGYIVDNVNDDINEDETNQIDTEIEKGKKM